MKHLTLIIVAIALVAFWGWWVFPQQEQGLDQGPTQEMFLEDSQHPIKLAQNNQISNSQPVDFLSVKEGFEVSFFAEGLSGPRVISFDPNGVMLVSLPSLGQIVALPDRDGDGLSDEKVVVASGLNEPHGIAFRDKEGLQLYVGETDAVSVFDYDQGSLKASNKKELFDLPFGKGHSTRTLLYLKPEDKLLVHVGSSCNVCVERDSRRASILIASPDGSAVDVYANGLRNSVFMAEHPRTGQIWATENGRDHLGDNIPPDEVNIIEQGKFYGWPYAYGDRVWDRQFDPSTKAKELSAGSTPAKIEIQAHSAPLGLTFLDESFSAEYDGDLLVAYHGSWNRSEPTGYKVVRYLVDENGQVSGQEDFITGFQQGPQIIGRPVAVAQREGVIYVSDDKAGNIYRITQNQK